MSLFETINTKEYKTNDISLYLESEIAEELIDEIYGKDSDEYIENFERYEEVLDDNDIVVLSRLRNSKNWFVEPLSYEDGQIINETDICFIQSDILDEIELNKISFNEVLVLGFEDDEVEEESDLLDEFANNLLDELFEVKDNECPHCIITKYLKIVENRTKNDVLDKISQLL